MFRPFQCQDYNRSQSQSLTIKISQGLINQLIWDVVTEVRSLEVIKYVESSLW